MCISALDVLKKYGIKISLPIDINSLLEQLKIQVKEYDFSKVEDYPNQIAGFIKKTNDGQAIILVNHNDNITRQRFTTAHELGHYFLHMNDNESEPHIELRTPSRTPKEIAADNFAAELLMPEPLVKKEYDKLMFGTATELCKKFNVSFTAMKYRLDTLGLWHYD